MDNQLFRRSKYSDHLRLTAADLENQQTYDSGKRRLLNTALFGCGVVCGLTVENLPGRRGVSVGCGLAVDGMGRELSLPCERFIPTSQLFLKPPEQTDGWCLCIRYEERECGEGHILEPDGTHRQTANRVEEDVRILALRYPGEAEVTIARLLLASESGCTVEIGGVKYQPPRLTLCKRTRVTSGILCFSDLPQQCGQVLYSEEIPHGLGAGNVLVTLGAEAGDGERSCIISGDTGLFGSELRMSAKLFPDRGTFVAAVCPCGGFYDKVALRWYARRAEEPAMGGLPLSAPQKPKAADEPMRLQPHIATLYPGETESFFVDGTEGRLCVGRPHFHLQSGGGTIDDRGLYTAPQTAGAYKIEAVLSDNPHKALYAWAIVLERK